MAVWRNWLYALLLEGSVFGLVGSTPTAATIFCASRVNRWGWADARTVPIHSRKLLVELTKTLFSGRKSLCVVSTFIGIPTSLAAGHIRG